MARLSAPGYAERAYAVCKLLIFGFIATAIVAFSTTGTRAAPTAGAPPRPNGGNATSSIVENAKVICSQFKRGNDLVTRSCPDGFVCAGNGCSPGPEMLRQMAADQAAREKAAKLEKEKQELRRELARIDAELGTNAARLDRTRHEIAVATERLQEYQRSLDEWMELSEEARNHARDIAWEGLMSLTVEGLLHGQELAIKAEKQLAHDARYAETLSMIDRHLLAIGRKFQVQPNTVFLERVLLALKDEAQGAKEIARSHGVPWEKVVPKTLEVANIVFPTKYSLLITSTTAAANVWFANAYLVTARQFSRARVDQMAALQGKQLEAIASVATLYKKQVDEKKALSTRRRSIMNQLQ